MNLKRPTKLSKSLRAIAWRRLLFASLSLLCFGSAQAENNFTFVINGVDDAIRKNITNRLAIFDRTQHQPLPPAGVASVYHQGIDEVKQAVQPFGYFKTTVVGELALKANNQWQITYTIHLGAPLQITHTQIELVGPGQNDQHYQQYLRQNMPKTGQPFSSQSYETAKKQMMTYAFEHGYLSATWLHHEVRINRQLKRCEIFLVLQTGPRYQFGSATFSGSELNKTFLRRYLTFKPGKAYNEQDLRSLQQNLMGSGYFNSVQINSHRKQAQGNQVPIEIVLNPAQRKHYQLGLGWGTDTGARGLASLRINTLNHNGHKLYVNLRGSQYQEQLDVQYMVPGVLPAQQMFTIGGYVKQEDDDKVTSLSQAVGVSFSQLWHEWHVTPALNVEKSRSKLARQPTYKNTLVVPSLHAQWHHANHSTNPDEGLSIDWLLQGASQTLGSDISFLQNTLRIKTLNALSESRNQLLSLRLNAGITASELQERLPLDYQFYVGGSQSLRGYGYRAIGPGRNFYTASAELRQRIRGNWYAAAFVDAGNAGSSIWMKPKRAMGLGLVYRTLVGNFQLSAAKPLDKAKQSLVFEFSMGPAL